jgi:hypothetical protein
MDEILYKNIANSTAHRPSRDFNSAYIFDNPEALPDLMAIAFDLNDKNHHKACWVLELVFEKHISWLAPFLQAFCNKLAEYSHDGALRSVSKICLFAAREHLKKVRSGSVFLSENQLNQLTEACFDWLITNTKVASKAYAMRALFEIGKLHDWIYTELREILPKDFPAHSAGYQAAAKDLLRKMK